MIDSEISKFIKDIKSRGYELQKYAYNNQEFIPGKSTVYYSGPFWDDAELLAAIKALLVGDWISSGEKVKKFEKEFSRILKENFGVMVNSGSSANLIMIAALKKLYGWNNGDEIIVSPVGFPTTISSIVQNNLRPVFVDIELETLNFDVTKIEEKITEKTVGIFVSPVLGNPPDFDIITELCKKYNILFILDSCDSLGSMWKGNFLTHYAIASSHSFYPAHTISTGEGGMVTTKDRKISDLCKSLASWGRACICSGSENLLTNGICNKRFSAWLPDNSTIIDHKYVFDNMGYNLKVLDLQGAIGLSQLDKLTTIYINRIRSKEEISVIFEKHLDFIKIPKELDNADTVWFGTPIICDKKNQKERLVRFLESRKIQTRNYFAGNILAHRGYSHLGNYKEYPKANEVLDRVFFVGAAPHYDNTVFDYFDNILGEYNE